jgi:hypothetical protein
MSPGEPHIRIRKFQPQLFAKFAFCSLKVYERHSDVFGSLHDSSVSR